MGTPACPGDTCSTGSGGRTAPDSEPPESQGRAALTPASLTRARAPRRRTPQPTLGVPVLSAPHKASPRPEAPSLAAEHWAPAGDCLSLVSYFCSLFFSWAKCSYDFQRVLIYGEHGSFPSGKRASRGHPPFKSRKLVICIPPVPFTQEMIVFLSPLSLTCGL